MVYTAGVADPVDIAGPTSGKDSDAGHDLAVDGEESKPNYALHVGLFAATCVTTYLSGLAFAQQDPVGAFAFSGTLMGILLCHEMGHFIVARKRGIDASLPYFIPLPPMISLGTMGAVIRMRSEITDRNHLIEVGASGPIAGLVVAIPLLCVGLMLSDVSISQTDGETLLEGNSILYVGLKYLIHGQYLPASDGTDVQLHPMAFAAWVGLLITMINLIPVGQLDGGHIACGYLGDRHERLSGTLHWMLLVVGAGVVAYLVVDLRGLGADWGLAVWRGAWSGLPWLVWALLLLAMRRMSGGRYHPPVGTGGITAGHRWLVYLVLLIFVLIFMPIPLRQMGGF